MLKNKEYYLIFLIVFITTISLSVLFSSCTKDMPVQPDLSGINFLVEDVTSTEVILRVNVNLDKGNRVLINRNDSLIYDINLFGGDTLIIDERLLPGREYRYTGVLLNNNGERSYGNEIKVRTLDTTTRNFTWQVFEFGDDLAASFLRDVAIIDENNIWAVGGIYLADSSRPGNHIFYNALHWDGNKWEFKKINFYTFCPDEKYPDVYPAHCIYAFDNENMCIGGNGVAFLKNGIQVKLKCTPSSNVKIFGESINNFYSVGGSNCNIAHWDGKKWTKIDIPPPTGNEYSTDIGLVDIHGTLDGKRIFICGYNTLDTLKSILIELNDNKARVKWYKKGFDWVEPYGGTVMNVYTSGSYLFLATAKGFYIENFRLGLRPKKVTDFAFDWIYAMRGNSYNDVFTFSDEPEIYHFNGVNLRKIFHDYTIPKVFAGGAVKGNLVVGVGTVHINPIWKRAWIVIGRRN